MRTRLMIIVNPASGRARAWQQAEAAAVLIEQAGAAVTVEKTVGSGSARSIAMRTADSVDALISVGGDGTLNEVVNGVADARSQTPVAIIPTGTANVVARELSLPEELSALVDIALRGSVRVFDLGMVGERRFTMCAGIGFDAAVVEAVHRHRTDKGITMASYYAPAFRELWQYGFPLMRVEVDGAVVSEGATFTIVANIKRYGGRFQFCPQATTDDGVLDVCCLHGRGVWRFLRYGWRALRHTLESCLGAVHVQGKEIHITNAAANTRPIPVQLDGDSFASLPQTFTIEPKAVRFCVR